MASHKIWRGGGLIAPLASHSAKFRNTAHTTTQDIPIKNIHLQEGSAR